jgi:isoleucyl-tRNA synthetase
LIDVRNEVNRTLENARVDGLIRSSLEAEIEIEAEDSQIQVLGKYEEDLKEIFIVSSVSVCCGDNLKVSVKRAEGRKCPRCWLWSLSVEEDGLCKRCMEVAKWMQKSSISSEEDC